MNLEVTGNVHRLGDHVDTDAILPGRYLAIRDPDQLAAHCLESLDPDFRARVRPGDIVVAGRNFGTGSSREHAVIALKAAGIRAIVVESAARIFFRNAINLGLPVLVSPEASRALQAGRAATVRVATHDVEQDGTVWPAQKLGTEVNAILACGGLMARTKQLLATDSALSARTESSER